MEVPVGELIRDEKRRKKWRTLTQEPWTVSYSYLEKIEAALKAEGAHVGRKLDCCHPYVFRINKISTLIIQHEKSQGYTKNTCAYCCIA